MELKSFLKTMSLLERDEFAKRCGTTAGHLRNIAYGDRSCGESLAIAIDRESDSSVTCEELRSDVDWAHLRGSSLTTTNRKCG
jgi:DNA-binding transcriptional regulator YdaS (Cro superfamily)